MAAYVATRTVDLWFMPAHGPAHDSDHLAVAGGIGNGIPVYPGDRIEPVGPLDLTCLVAELVVVAMLLAMIAPRLRGRGGPVLVAHALAGADDAGRELIESRLGDPTLDDEVVQRLRDAITAAGAVDAVEADIARLAGSARMALKSTRDLSPEATGVLDQLIDSATRRAG